MRPSLFVLAALLAACSTPPSTPPPDLGRDLVLAFPEGCMNGGRDGNETDVDCGGDACKKCDAGQMCLHGSDCTSTICDNNVCAGPSCTDRLLNGSETDMDCGGTCPGCAVGRKCLRSGDCTSGNCVNNVCQPGACMNNVKDGMETDVDCGGPTCPACANGKACLMGSDCQVMRCINNVCQTPINCTPPMANCDGNQQSGCNVNLNTDAKNCGKCGMVCPMNMPACVGGKCDGTNGKVLVIAPHSQRPQDLQDTATLLRGTGAFTVVDTFDAQVAAPTVAQLSAYGAVLIFAESGVFVDPVTFGDNLATYFDNGGRVVVAVMNTGSMPQGRFFTVGNGYILLNQSKLQGALGDPLGKIHEPMSPLLVDVKTFANSDAYTTSPVANGGIVVAESAAKVPMIVRGVFKGRNRVDINFVAAPKYWTGDGAALLRNALTY